MEILRQENLPSVDVHHYKLAIEFRKQFLWPKDGSSDLEYEEDDKRMVFFLAMNMETNDLEGVDILHKYEYASCSVSFGKFVYS